MRRIFRSEGSNYFLLLGTTLFLVIFGAVMVLSSSSIESLAVGEEPFAVAIRHGLFMIVGIPLMLIASRMPITFWKRWAVPGLLFALGLQLLVFVPGIGIAVAENRNWIAIGSFTFQPSELIKLTIAIWLGMILARRVPFGPSWRDALVPAVPVAGFAILLVLLGNDLGTVMILVSIMFACLFFAGVKLRFLGVMALGGALVALIVAVASPNRMARILAFLHPTAADYEGSAWQVTHASYALASGGVFGVGLGNSKAKWSWLPTADSDFIFAIIGEELGLIGAIVVLLLFVLLAISFVRIINAARDPFAKIVTGGIMVWIVGQALVNIAVVLQVLPVLGVPLPMISSGGSALVTTLLGIGVVLSFARAERAQGEPTP